MAYGCLATNGLIFRTGESNCHGLFDFTLSSNGSIVIITDAGECIRNRLWVYMSTKKGERLDPRIGCCLHNYTHKPLTSSVIKAIEADFKYELQNLVFPEAKTVSVMAYKVDQKTVRLVAQIDDDDVIISVDKITLQKMNDMVKMTMADLGFPALWGSRN